MDLKKIIDRWIATGNQYDTETYLSFFLPDAILDDRSVGRQFNAHTGIRKYFTAYFTGYKTQTKLLRFEDDGNVVNLEVEFTGAFPEGKLKGCFVLLFRDDKIQHIKANLIQ